MEEMFETIMKAGEIYHSLKIEKNTKGYNWEIKVAGADKEKVKTTLVELEKFCRETYGTKE